jgi:hypothetical protein
VGVPLVLSCQLLLTHHDLSGDADRDAGGPVVDPCSHAALPPPPPPDAANDTSVGDLWFATDRITIPLGQDGGVKPGLDLDNACTCLPDLHGGAPPCRTPYFLTPPSDRQGCDFDAGVDDALGATALGYGAFLQGNFDLAASVNQRAATGYRTFLLYVAGYNGQADDPSVDVAVISSGGLYDPADCKDPEQPLPNLPRSQLQHAPKWNGCDRWSPAVGRTTDAFPARKTKTVPGWVSNYTIAAHLGQVAATFFGQSADLSGASALATIIREDGGPSYRLEGFLAGRIAFADAASLVGGTESVSPDGGRQNLCDTGLWNLVETDLCSARDTMSDPNLEFEGGVCDAVSLVIGFSARQAQVSNDEYDQPLVTPDCDATIDCK